MFSRIAVAALSAGLAFSAIAETPNLQPGNWEHTSTVTFNSEFPIPDQSDTSTNCITEEDINNGDAFVQDMEECEVTHRDVRSDGMDYSLNCDSADGTSMTMEASLKFMGDSMEGTVNGDMETPMGAMQMNVTMTGRRIGDC